MAPASSSVRRLSWRAWLIYIHRWLGIAGCVLFIAWFVSGIVMMYARMPSVTQTERLQHAAPLDASSIIVSPADAAARAGVSAGAGMQLTMLDGRPVYRFPGPNTTTVFADRGDVLTNVGRDDAMAIATRWVSGATAPRYDDLVATPDQWTLQTRQHLPLHRIGLNDAADSYVYVSSKTGDVVMETSSGERFWAYWGPVLHWLYLPVLRRNGPLWTQVIIWTSGIGCVMCIAGLVIGLLRYSPSARFRWRGTPRHSPYAGMMRWHHYAGLIFGVITFTWTFSGLLSMGPFSWLSNGRLAPEQRATLAGDVPPFDQVTAPRVRAAIAALTSSGAPRELTLIAFQGEWYWASEQLSGEDAGGRRATPVAMLQRALVSAVAPERGAFPRFDEVVMERVARSVMAGVPVRDAVWLDQYDAYYYDRQGARPLPVLRVRYDDGEGTWLYLDPHRGNIALMSRPSGRLNRWLYQGLHSLDFPALYYQRPLWDVVVIALSLGGIALGVTSLWPAWIRLRGHARRFMAVPRANTNRWPLAVDDERRTAPATLQGE